MKAGFTTQNFLRKKN
ncbi:hypothetical protein RLOC_00014976 [Lonchura striata]|uniref:Uncharacterized protein n=1 Tax=Lonchura striata TaxID=40157 RepID=A0A218V383_9PASE|nr:hypothetical protein RLOC_00014976 [Lonchura striata domestica]